jgi:hypothetical protein
MDKDKSIPDVFCAACGIKEPFKEGEDKKPCPNPFRNGKHEWYTSFNHGKEIASTPDMQVQMSTDKKHPGLLNSKIKQLATLWIDRAQEDMKDYMKDNINATLYERLKKSLRDSIYIQIKEELLND